MPKAGLDRSVTGRAKGTVNKTTALLKDAVLRAATQAGNEDGSDNPEGLVAFLRARALDTPGPFLALLGKVLPLQITGDKDGSPVNFTVIYEAKKGMDYTEISGG